MSKKSKTIIYTLLTFMALYFLSPFVYILFITFKTETETIACPPRLSPAKWLWENYISAWKTQPFNRCFLNSILVAVGTAVGRIISCFLVAYGSTRYNFKGKNIMFMILLSTMIIPWGVTVIPQYMEFKVFGWINTLKPLIVPSRFGSTYYIFLIRQSLVGVPKDFEEVARIDGADAFQIYWRIFIPIMKPQLILVDILDMITVWNDYLGPLTFSQDRNKFALALRLASFKGVHNTQIMPMLYITVIMILPPIIVFLFAQKHIVEGASGAIRQSKGDNGGKT